MSPEKEDSYGRFQASVAEAFEPLAQALDRIHAMPIDMVRKIGRAVAQTQGRPVVLVVDYDESIQTAWRVNLRRHALAGGVDIECVVAGSADEAMRVIGLRDRIDVLVLDHLLGDMTGLEVVAEFRLKFEYALVVVSSGLDSPELRVAYLRMGEPIMFSPKKIPDEQVIEAVKEKK